MQLVQGGQPQFPPTHTIRDRTYQDFVLSDGVLPNHKGMPEWRAERK